MTVAYVLKRVKGNDDDDDINSIAPNKLSCMYLHSKTTKQPKSYETAVIYDMCGVSCDKIYKTRTTNKSGIPRTDVSFGHEIVASLCNISNQLWQIWKEI